MDKKTRKGILTVDYTKDSPKTITGLKSKKEWDNIDILNAELINWIYRKKNQKEPFAEIPPLDFSRHSHFSDDERERILHIINVINLMRDWLELENTRLDVACNQCYDSILYNTAMVELVTAIEEGLKEKHLPQNIMDLSISAYVDGSKDDGWLFNATTNQVRAVNAMRHILTYNHVIKRIASVTGITAIKKLETEQTSFYTDMAKEYNEKIEKFNKVVDDKAVINYNYPVKEKELKKDVFNRVFQPINMKVPKRSIDELIEDYSLFDVWSVSEFYEKKEFTNLA